jgi:assimilatory nitrate reductase catalytic subunit
VTNSERRISRQRSVLAAPGKARDDWRILADVAGLMGWGESFAWDSAAEIFSEYAALSGVAGDLGADFDISDHAAITSEGYEALAPFTWPANPRKSGGRYFSDGMFHTPDGKARMIAVRPSVGAKDRLPFRLNTGRIRDQWHTMTRTAKSPRLSAHLGEPFLELHPADANRLGLETADLAEVTNTLGTALLRVLVTDRVAPGHPFAPMHWTGETASAGRVDVLVAANPDPVSGQPDSKASQVSVRKFAARWYAFAISVTDFRPDCTYWAKARVAGGWRAELAGAELPTDWEIFARATFGLSDVSVVSVADPARGLARMAFHQAGQLVAALFVGPSPIAVARDPLAARLGAGDLTDILAGRTRADMPDPGPTVCACLAVGRNTICQAIESGKAMTVPALGEVLGAGTSCGSCQPELAALIAQFRHREAAE